MTYRPYPSAARALRQVQRHPRPASPMRLVSAITVTPAMTSFIESMAEASDRMRESYIREMTRIGSAVNKALAARPTDFVLRP